MKIRERLRAAIFTSADKSAAALRQPEPSATPAVAQMRAALPNIGALSIERHSL